MKNIEDAEYWVMRRWRMYKDGKYYPVTLSMMTPSAQVATLALLSQGKLACLPDDTLAEPVEVFDTEQQAIEHRRVLTTKHPDEDFRVVMNVDVEL
jgi:hypothetical protein